MSSSMNKYILRGTRLERTMYCTRQECDRSYSTASKSQESYCHGAPVNKWIIICETKNTGDMEVGQS